MTKTNSFCWLTSARSNYLNKKMKKILFLAAASALTFANAQVIFEENFETYNLGNVVNQGGWGVDGGTSANAKVAVLDEAHGQSLNVKRSSVSDMWVFNDFTANSAVDGGNDLIKMSFKINFGSAAGATSIQFYNLDSGFAGVASFDHYEGNLILYSNLTEDILLLSNPFELNKWYDVTIVYEYELGTLYAVVDGVESDRIVTEAYYDIHEMDIFTGDGLVDLYIDDISIVAMSSEEMRIHEIAKGELNIYPNPATDMINVDSQKVVKTIEVLNTIGQSVATNHGVDQINVASLNKGVYIVKVTFEDGSVEWKKVIKK